MNRFRTISMLLAATSGLLVVMLVALFAMSAVNAYERKQEANQTLMGVRRTAEALQLKETVRIELGVVETALHAPEPAKEQVITRIMTLHARSEQGLKQLDRHPRKTQKQWARMTAVLRERTAYNVMFQQVMSSLRSPRSGRSQALTDAWTGAVVRMLDAVDAQSLDHLDAISNTDSFINVMMKINDLAWRMRAIAGADRRVVADAILDARPLSQAQRDGFADAGGRVGALWTLIEISHRERPFPPRLKAAFEKAGQVYLRDYLRMRSSILDKLANGHPVALSGEDWLRLSNPGLNSIIEISKSALAISEEYAAELARRTHRTFNIAVGLMLASIVLASSGVLYVVWRVIVPLKTITGTLRSIAGGDLAHDIPFAHRRDEVGQFAQALHLFRDSAVTQRRLETEALRNQAAKVAAETSNRLKSEFLANMSHELRTPLNAILGFSEMIGAEIRGPVLPQYRDYANDIHSAGAHLLALINDILDLSKAEAGKLELCCERVDIARLIEECVKLVRGRAVEHDLRIRLAIGSLPPLFADRLRVKQILLNLLSNAIKFTPEGGQVSVDATCETDGQLVIHICDTGIGIAPEMISLAFEPFRQVDSILARKFEGTGLGLPLVKTFVELHGGDVGIESALGNGTTVTVRFPKSRTVADTVAMQVG